MAVLATAAASCGCLVLRLWWGWLLLDWRALGEVVLAGPRVAARV